MDKATSQKFDSIRKEALEFLMTNSTAVVATSIDNVPAASTVYYIVDEDFNFYFATQVDTNKYLNMSRNSKVALVIGTGPLHVTVTVQGTCDFIFDEEKEALTERLMELMLRERVKRWPIEDMEKFKKSRMATFVVKPERLTFMNLDDERYPESMSDKYMAIIPKS